MKTIMTQSAEKPQLLIVDDSAENLQVLNALLKDYYRLKLAKSAAKCLEIAQQEPQPDLILLDVIMPEMDGLSLRQALAERSHTAVTPFVFISGSDDDVVARQLREAASREADPAVREKLWEEYRKYKGLQ